VVVDGFEAVVKLPNIGVAVDYAAAIHPEADGFASVIDPDNLSLRGSGIVLIREIVRQNQR